MSTRSVGNFGHRRGFHIQTKLPPSHTEIDYQQELMFVGVGERVAIHEDEALGPGIQQSITAPQNGLYLISQLSEDEESTILWAANVQFTNDPPKTHYFLIEPQSTFTITTQIFPNLPEADYNRTRVKIPFYLYTRQTRDEELTEFPGHLWIYNTRTLSTNIQLYPEMIYSLPRNYTDIEFKIKKLLNYLLYNRTLPGTAPAHEHHPARQ